MAHYSGSGAHGKFPTEPTDTMIVRNLDLNSTEKSISDAFGYITKELFIGVFRNFRGMRWTDFWKTHPNQSVERFSGVTEIDYWKSHPDQFSNQGTHIIRMDEFSKNYDAKIEISRKK